MTDLVNHPGAFLSSRAAASLLRMENAHGAPFHGSSFGRTVAEQQGLIDDWNKPAAGWNRPPNLYKPYMPAEDGPHVVNGGEAFDDINAAERAWIDAYGREYGWYRNIPDGDPVHVIYVSALDQHRDDAPALARATHPTKGKTMKMINVRDFGGEGHPAKILIEEGKPDRVVPDDAAANLIGAIYTDQDFRDLPDISRGEYNTACKVRGL